MKFKFENILVYNITLLIFISVLRLSLDKSIVIPHIFVAGYIFLGIYDFMFKLEIGTIFFGVLVVFSIGYFFEVFYKYPFQTSILMLIVYGIIYTKLYQLVIDIFTINPPKNNKKSNS